MILSTLNIYQHLHWIRYNYIFLLILNGKYFKNSKQILKFYYNDQMTLCLYKYDKFTNDFFLQIIHIIERRKNVTQGYYK